MAGQSRKKPSPDIPVPDISEDAIERKRVLNVLAQRRYRKRKREQLHALQSQVNGQSPSAEQNDQPPENEDPTGHEEPVATPQMDDPAPQPEALPNTMETAHRPSLSSSRYSMSEYVNFGFTAFPAQMSPAHLNSPDHTDTSWLPSPNTPSCSSSAVNTHNTAAPDIDPWYTLLDDTISTPLGVSMAPAPPRQDLSSSLQDRQTSTFSFPDDYLLTVLELDLLRACLSIAQRLGCEQLIWNLDSISPFFGADPPSHSSSASQSPASHCADLPMNLIPTRTQRYLPHHPILDLLPWPTARDKLIQVFTQPPEMRPPAAADPMSLVQLVYDMEDSAEGIRIWGSDPFDGDSWEVGQVFFERWWWALESGIVNKSNEWRAARGAMRLRLPGMMTIGSEGVPIQPVLIG